METNINKNGFTLIELLVSMVIFAGLMFVADNLLISVLQNPQQYTIAMDNVEHSKMVAATFVEELRNASTGNDGSYPLSQAGDSQIVFYTKFGSTGTAVDRIRYYFSGSTLYKGVIVPTGSPLSYNLAAEVVKPIITVISNGPNPVFYYYDGNYGGSGTPISQPVNINNIKFAEINLLVQSQLSKTSTSSFPITAGAAIRNLKDNLGD